MSVLHTDLTQKLDVIRLTYIVNHRVRFGRPVIVCRAVFLWIVKDLVLVMCDKMGTFNRLIKPMLLPQ